MSPKCLKCGKPCPDDHRKAWIYRWGGDLIGYFCSDTCARLAAPDRFHAVIGRERRRSAREWLRRQPRLFQEGSTA